jgi:hypothetical protein
MRQLTASQKIAILENRVAQLEKQAIIQTIKNMGVSVLRPLSQVAADITSSLKAISAKEDKNVLKALEQNLEARLNRSLERNFLFGKNNTIEVLSFDSKNPMNSVLIVNFHLNGEKKIEKTNIKSVPRNIVMTDELKKDIQGTYVSWWKDWESILQIINTGKVDKTTTQRVIQGVKSVSKFFYRVLTAFTKLAALYDAFDAFINGFVVSVIKKGVAYFVLSPLAIPLLEITELLENGYVGPLIKTVLAKFGDFMSKKIEGAFRRRKVNIDTFNELAGKSASVNKYARKYPHTYSMLLRLESAGV